MERELFLLKKGRGGCKYRVIRKLRGSLSSNKSSKKEPYILQIILT